MITAPSRMASMSPRYAPSPPLLAQTNEPQAESSKNPTVQKALDRWFPEKKEVSFWGGVDNSASSKPALAFLANPNKVGLFNFALWTTAWAVSDILTLYSLQHIHFNLFSKNKGDTPVVEKSLTEFLKKNAWIAGGVVLLSAVIEVLNSVAAANAQKETNNTALKAIQNKGINATLGDS